MTLLMAELVRTRPQATYPTMATWYVWMASAAMTTVTPTTSKSIYTTAHHVKDWNALVDLRSSSGCVT